jgi:hypothetical protein
MRLSTTSRKETQGPPPLVSPSTPLQGGKKYQGQPRRSIRLYINHCNSGPPPNEPLCSCILFGKEDYFLDKERKSRGPPVGFHIVVLSDNSTVDDEDFEDDSD